MKRAICPLTHQQIKRLRSFWWVSWTSGAGAVLLCTKLFMHETASVLSSYLGLVGSICLLAGMIGISAWNKALKELGLDQAQADAVLKNPGLYQR